MKTVIRRGVFETNSSSTHSLTIQKKTLNNDVLIDGILYPEEILNFSKELTEDVIIIKCDTFESKLSLLLLIVYDYFKYENQEVYDKLLKFLEWKYDIKEIIKPEEGLHAEDGHPQISNVFEELIDNLEDYFNQCEDDNVELVHIIERW